MNRILLLVENKQNRRLLSEWLAMRYEVISPDLEVAKQEPDFLLAPSFDLCIVCGRSLDQFWESVQRIRELQQPVFLPFLLITSRADVRMVTRHLWQTIDDLIAKPIEKVELQARVEILLRSRQYSQNLKAANQELQSEIAYRQQVEAALAQSEAKFRALVQNSSDVIKVLEGDGTITYASPSSQMVLGLSREELEGTNVFDYIHPDDLTEAIATFKASLTNPGETQISEYRFRHQDGSWHYLESKSNFSNTETILTGIVVNSRDITIRKRAEEDMLEALQKERELNELKSRFVAMVSHEIRNPLNTILAATQILENYSDKWSVDKKREFFERIKKNVKTMTALLDNVLIIGRSDQRRLEVKPVPLDLEKFTRNLIEEIKLSTSCKHAIAFEKHTNDACINQSQCISVCLDESLLRHILTNLLTNAIKYSPEGSTIRFNLLCQNEQAIFQIQDEGIGISPEDQQQLFESFQRASNVKNIPGTGLGLAIVKRCVDLQGGNIAVTSEIGVGTTFTVTLPLQNSVSMDANDIVSTL
ncbi:PAS domain S-box protein [Trichocoleus sp. FACHB-90]|uniref:sensor histidine kinase n=1 Tax=Cyanophyceae TaxID=3028117 RepID=UPI001683D8A8|nr:ATP-binding protein [Trichocoleus sp. FACHB-90]MBD1925179.1 PAS domain S-box protein [Trichocoleus sp. FACHB-90]